MVAALILCATGGLLVSFLSSNYLSGAVQGYRERKAEREFLASSLTEARRERLTFPQVVVAHPAHLGKPVYWDVTVTSATSSDAVGYAEGRPAWRVLWTNPDRVWAERLSSHERVLARVAVVKDDVVSLTYLGRP